MQNLYSLLGLRRDAALEEIRRAHFEAARRFHPDTNTAPGETELFLDIQRAYEILSDPQKRAEYDASLPPEPAPGVLLDQKILFSRQGLLRSKEQQVIYALLEFSVPADMKTRPSPPLNVCLVLDRSTSMKGRNLDVVKATAVQLIRQLKPQDIFSVVAFSDRAETIIPAAKNEETGRQEARIQMLQPSGGTEILSGLQSGFDEILRNANRSQVNHIILLTDGHTYGDEEGCFALAKKAAEKGIGISGLGIGSEWNDAFLDKLATLTGGSSVYVSQPNDIQHALLDKINRLGLVYSNETKLDFQCAEGIEVRYAFRLQPEVGLLPFGSPMVLGPVLWNNSLKVLMEFVVRPEALDRTTLNLLKGELTVVIAEQFSQLQNIPFQLVRRVLDETSAEPPPAEIVQALSRMKLYRIQEQARLDAATGNFEQAAEQLSRLATHLLAQGERGLAKTVLMEAKNIYQKKTFSQQGEKAIKYGTRALLGSG